MIPTVGIQRAETAQGWGEREDVGSRWTGTVSGDVGTVLSRRGLRGVRRGRGGEGIV